MNKSLTGFILILFSIPGCIMAQSNTFMTILMMGLFLIGCFLSVSDYNSKKDSKEDVLCVSCHTSGKADVSVRGSLGVELALWACLLLPGFIYSIWRQCGKDRKCKSCGSLEIIPINSPKAIKILNG